MLMTFSKKNKTFEDISSGTQEAVNRERSVNTMAKRNKTKGLTMTLHQKLKTEQHNAHKLLLELEYLLPLF